MHIKKQYTREQLEKFSVRRIKRTFMIARQAMFTKMRLIDKIMKRMDEIYSKPKVIKSPLSIIEFNEPEPELILSREELENIKWKTLVKQYGIVFNKGITKQVAIEKILKGEFKLK